MSHFSRIKTSLRDLNTLQATLTDLGLNYKCAKSTIKDYNGVIQDVDITIKSEDNYIYGFAWNGQEYVLLADLQLWNVPIPVDNFIEKITQVYAYNSVLESSKQEGFERVDHKVLQDGSIKLIMQRWS